MVIEFGMILGLILANGVLAGAEIAVVGMRKTRLRELVGAGSGAARAVEALRARPEAFLATVQIGITVVGATTGAFGGATIAARVEPWLRNVAILEPYASQLSLGLVIATIAYLSLILGELVPKSLAMRSSEGYALLIARPLLGLSRVAKPFVWILTASSNTILRLFGDRTNFTEARLSAEELRQIVDEAAEFGTLHPRTGDIASRAIDFGRLHAADVMVPRRSVLALARGASQEEIRALVLEAKYARVPVYDGALDNVVGFIPIREALRHAARGPSIPLEPMLRPAYFVPETMGAADLLHEMQNRRLDLAVVVDEQGCMVGIATTEDLVEELVGEIFSEPDHAAPLPIERQPDGSYLIQGTAHIRDVNRETGLDLPEGEYSTTIAGLCLELAGKIPQVGERCTTRSGVVLEVADATPRRVRVVRVPAVGRPPLARETGAAGGA